MFQFLIDTTNHFSKAGDPGIVVAHELLLKQTTGVGGYLTAFVAEKRLESTFDILLDCIVNYRSPPAVTTLAGFGKGIATRLVEALAEAKREGQTILVGALDELSYTNCVPALGKLLMQLPRRESGDLKTSKSARRCSRMLP